MSPPPLADVDLSEDSVQDVLDIFGSPTSHNDTLFTNNNAHANANDTPLAQLFQDRFSQLFVMCETILKQQVVLGAEHARLHTELATMREEQEQASVSIVWTYLNDTLPRLEQNVDSMSKKMDLLARGMGQIDDKVSPLVTQTQAVDSTVKEVHQTLQELSKSVSSVDLVRHHRQQKQHSSRIVEFPPMKGGMGGKITGGVTSNSALASSIHRFGNHGLVQMRNPKQTVSPLKRLRSGRAVADSPTSKLLLNSSGLPLLQLTAPEGMDVAGLLDGSDLSDLTESGGESEKEDDGDFPARKRVKRGPQRSRGTSSGKKQSGGNGAVKTPVNKAGRVRRKKGAARRMGPKPADPSLGDKAETDMIQCDV
ncbi:12151_t:CDS:2 [Acaulospora colombiana]|uniref:12151_t:CDS:1 n=1 Tax=Acaulospora colombiana TaxID=27376 RepID=A0ACA9LPP5_9GLOM|nr:12151_t:CDS:2 [Acaulospora colombiana]